MDGMNCDARQRIINALSTYKDEIRIVKHEFFARKTEYNGVVFDSKCEAVFARVLDLAGYEWQPHPREVNGHPFDFFITGLRGRGTYVEYKPSAPTDTYISNLTEMMRQDPVESLLVWGNPFSDVWHSVMRGCCYVSYPLFSSDGKYGWGDFIQAADNGESIPYSHRHRFQDIFSLVDSDIVREAKRYRFDLR